MNREASIPAGLRSFHYLFAGVDPVKPQIIKPAGKSFNVNLCDISWGGLYFFVRITKRETASLLLGQRFCISYLHPGLHPSLTVKQSGTVAEVRFDPLEDCSVNVKCDSLLPETLIGQLEKLSPLWQYSDF